MSSKGTSTSSICSKSSSSLFLVSHSTLPSPSSCEAGDLTQLGPASLSSSVSVFLSALPPLLLLLLPPSVETLLFFPNSCTLSNEAGSSTPSPRTTTERSVSISLSMPFSAMAARSCGERLWYCGRRKRMKLLIDSNDRIEDSRNG